MIGKSDRTKKFSPLLDFDLVLFTISNTGKCINKILKIRLIFKINLKATNLLYFLFLTFLLLINKLGKIPNIKTIIIKKNEKLCLDLLLITNNKFTLLILELL
jgi:hypothetical protein